MSIAPTYTGNYAFEDAYEPVPGKSEWGMDTLVRTMRGGQVNLVAFIESLAQGQTYTFNGAVFYLQSWEPDNDLVFPGVKLLYKGLVGGIPAPKAHGHTVEQSITLTTNTPQNASRTIRYVTRQATTLYIATSRPTAPTYGLDVSVSIYVLQSVITTQDGAVFNGANAPAGLVIALTPAAAVQAFMECNPVVGSPYFECTDTATLLYGGS